MKMNKKKLAISIVLIGVATAVGSYILLPNTIGEETSTSTQILQFENYANQVTIGENSYLISNVEEFTEENIVDIYWGSNSQENFEVGGEYENEGITRTDSPTYTDKASISEDAYNTAKQNTGKTIVLQEEKSKTHSPPLFLISASLGIATSLIFAAVWLNRQEAIGNATSLMLEEGLGKMSVRDAEIFGETIRRQEFTIPELMKEAGTSKTKTWRTVKKLVEEGLVEETEKTRAPSKGLGGRGKPSKIYKYVGSESEKQ